MCLCVSGRGWPAGQPGALRAVRTHPRGQRRPHLACAQSILEQFRIRCLLEANRAEKGHGSVQASTLRGAFSWQWGALIRGHHELLVVLTAHREKASEVLSATCPVPVPSKAAVTVRQEHLTNAVRVLVGVQSSAVLRRKRRRGEGSGRGVRPSEAWAG